VEGEAVTLEGITVREIAAMVAGGPLCPAAEGFIGKLKATKEPPARLDEVVIRESIIRGLKVMLRDPRMRKAKRAGVAVSAETFAGMVQKLVDAQSAKESVNG
jgi:hypothetical protein